MRPVNVKLCASAALGPANCKSKAARQARVSEFVRIKCGRLVFMVLKSLLPSSYPTGGTPVKALRPKAQAPATNGTFSKEMIFTSHLARLNRE